MGAGLTRSPEHCLALVVWLKSFQRLGYFPELFEVPIAVVEHVRGYLGLGRGVEPAHDSDRTAKRHRSWVRQRLRGAYDIRYGTGVRTGSPGLIDAA